MTPTAPPRAPRGRPIFILLASIGGWALLALAYRLAKVLLS